jgi:hypothetical protein
MGFAETMDKIKAFLGTKLDEVIYGVLVLGLATVLQWFDKLGAELWVVVALGIPAMWAGKTMVSGIAQASAAKSAMKAAIAGITQPDQPQDPPAPGA